MRTTLRSVALALVLATALPLACSAPDTADAVADATAATGRFEIFVGEDGQHYFQLLAGNGEKVLRSEGYTSLSGCKNGVKSVILNGTTKSQYKILAAQNGEYYFNLVAKNGQIVATSETYVSYAGAQQARDNTLKLVANASTAQLPTGDPHFESFTGSDGKVYFRLRAGNGEIVLQSQGYEAQSGADAGIASVTTNGAIAARYKVLAAKKGQYYFRITAANGEIVARGEVYASKANAERGAETVREIIGELGGDTGATLEPFAVDACVRMARECSFARLDGAIDADEAAEVFGACLGEAVLDDPDAEGADCSTACNGDGAELCEGIVEILPVYAAQPAACGEVFGECVDYCHGEGDNWNDGISPDEVSYTAEYQCIVDGSHDNCDLFARAHEACGGGLEAGGKEACLAQCKAAVEPWAPDMEEEVSDYCDGQCE
jgi:uncharacterized protein